MILKNKSIAIASEGNVHIVYGTGEYNDLSIIYGNNVGGVWSSPTLIKKHTRYCALLIPGYGLKTMQKT